MNTIVGVSWFKYASEFIKRVCEGGEVGSWRGAGTIFVNLLNFIRFSSRSVFETTREVFTKYDKFVSIKPCTIFIRMKLFVSIISHCCVPA